MTILSHGQFDTSDLVSLVAGLLWKSWSVWFSSKTDGKQNHLERFMAYITENSNETEILLRPKPKNLSRTGWCKLLKTTTQITMKMILIPLPRSYGINFGNHISPGIENCVRFPVSAGSWIYLTAQRRWDFGDQLNRESTPEWRHESPRTGCISAGGKIQDDNYVPAETVDMLWDQRVFEAYT